MSEFQQVNKAGVTRDLTPEAVVIWGTDGLPMGSAANPFHTTSDSTVVLQSTPDTVSSGTITATDVVVAAPAGAGAFVSGTSTSGSYVFSAVTGGNTAWDMQITGLTSGNLYFEGSLDSTNGIDGNWINLNSKQSGLNNASIVTVATANGLYRGNASGMKYFRVRSVGSLTGTPAVIIRLSFGVDALFLSAPLPAGTNSIGSISPVVGTPVDRSGTITTGGTAQSLLTTSTTRTTFFLSNPDAVNDLWLALNGITALANGTGSIRVPANGGGIGFKLPDPVRTAVSIVGTVTGQKFTSWET